VRLRAAPFGGRVCVVGVAVGALLVAGCAHQPTAGGDAVQAGLKPESREAGPRIEVASNIEGKVVSVRSDLRFAIIDFSFSRLPEPGALMGVLREGKRVGKVRITTRPSQARGGAIVADIREGEVLPGDLVSGMAGEEP